MEKGVKDRLEKPSKMHMLISEADNGGFHITHNPHATLSFESEPGEESHHSFGPKDGKTMLAHIKKHLNLGDGARTPFPGKELTRGKEEGEKLSKGEDVGLNKGAKGYKASGGRGEY